MYFRLTTLKIPPPNIISPTFLCNFFPLLGSTHDSTDCWNAHRSPAAWESFKCVQGWVASAGWHRPGGIGRVAPQTKILAMPVRRGTTADIGDNLLPSLTVCGCSLTAVEIETGRPIFSFAFLFSLVLCLVRSLCRGHLI